MPTKHPPGTRPWFPAQDAGEQVGAPARQQPIRGADPEAMSWLSPSRASWGSGTQSADRAAPETRCLAPPHGSAPGDQWSRPRGRPENLALPLRHVQGAPGGAASASALQAAGRRRLGTRACETPGAGAPQPHGVVPELPSAGGRAAPTQVRARPRPGKQAGDASPSGRGL